MTSEELRALDTTNLPELQPVLLKLAIFANDRYYLS